jgi:hypothetical protein
MLLEPGFKVLEEGGARGGGRVIGCVLLRISK